MSRVAGTHAQPDAPNGVGRSGPPRSLRVRAARIWCVVRGCGGGFPHAPGPPVGPGGSDAPQHHSGAVGAAVLLAGRLGGEVEVFDRDREAVAFGPVQQADEGVADLGVAVSGGAGQVVAEPEWLADGVAVCVQAPGGGGGGRRWCRRRSDRSRGPWRSAAASRRAPRARHRPHGFWRAASSRSSRTCRRRALANYSCRVRWPPGARLVPFCPTGRDSRCAIVRTPASSVWMCASWPRRVSAH